MKLTKITPDERTLLPTSEWTGTIRVYRIADRVILQLDNIAPTTDLPVGTARQLMALPQDLFAPGRTYMTISKRTSMASRLHVRVFGTAVHVLPINTVLIAGEHIGDRIDYSLL